jgi:hypothetical protein
MVDLRDEERAHRPPYSATGLLLGLHVSVAVVLAFVAGTLFFAAIEKRGS